MQIIKPDALNTLGLAKEMLSASGIMVYPTETTYGLGCAATDSQAVAKVYKLKQIPSSKPCLLVVDSLARAREYGEFSETAQRLVDQYWPGPLTLIVPAKPDSRLAPSLINQKNQTVGLRWSAYNLIEGLCRTIEQPLVSTSANVSGQAPAFSLDEVKIQFSQNINQMGLLIDGGILPEKKPSTLVQVINEEVKILRQGELFI